MSLPFYSVRAPTSPLCRQKWLAHRTLLRLIICIAIPCVMLVTPAAVGEADALSASHTPETAMTRFSCAGVYHIVRPGQTLHSIAAAYRTTAYRLVVCNGLSGYTVYVGQALLVPSYRIR